MTEANAPAETWMLPQASQNTLFHSSKISVGSYILRVLEGPMKGHEVPLEQEHIYIGRDEWCDLVLEGDRYISNRHCELRLTEEGVRVRDLQSSNGTFLTGHRIMDAYLSPGARLQIGESVMELLAYEQKQEVAIQHHDDSFQLVGQSESMRRIFDMLRRLGTRDVPVLLTGQTGTGKSQVARALHDQSRRAQRSFVVVNCGALPPTLIESSLFGYRKGAFTGADKNHAGFFEQAHKGTLFLDEIGEMPLELQPKLLDVLERQCVRPIGGTTEKEVDFRLIAATNRDLRQDVEAGLFRQDLYYRISVVELEIPPLQNRTEDIPLLAQFLLHKVGERAGAMGEYEFTAAAIQTLQRYPWPGNVRELRNILERALVFLDGFTIDSHDLQLPDYKDSSQRVSASTAQSPAPSLTSSPIASGQTLKEQLESVESLLIRETLEQNDWDVSKVSAILKVSKATLYERLRKYGIKRPE